MTGDTKVELTGVEQRVLDVIKATPGCTLNNIFYDHMTEELHGKFPPVYNAVKVLMDKGLIKKDGKKKNTGHYAVDAEIPEGKGTAVAKPTAVVKTVAPNGAVTTSAVTTIDRRQREAKADYVLQKQEFGKWVYVDESDFKPALETLMKSAVEILPYEYRVCDRKTGEVLGQMSGNKDLPVPAEDPVLDTVENEEEEPILVVDGTRG